MRSIESLNCAVDIIVTKMPRCSNSVPLLHGYTSFTTLIAGEDSNFEMEIVREVLIDILVLDFGQFYRGSEPITIILC